MTDRTSRRREGSAELSPQQRQVATLVARGYSNREMAAELGIALNTVEAVRYRLMKKLGLRSIAGLVHYAIGQGWVKLGDAR